jgi:hypothetical protein
LTTLVQDSIIQVTNETRITRETIETSTSGLATQGDIRRLNELLERLLCLQSARETAEPRVIEINDEHTEPNKPDTELETEASIRCILDAIRDKEDVFALDEAKDIGDALLHFLDRTLSGPLVDVAAANDHTHNGCRDFDTLQRNLRAAQGGLLMSREVSINESSR